MTERRQRRNYAVKIAAAPGMTLMAYAFMIVCLLVLCAGPFYFGRRPHARHH